ncbi:MAG: hypothetical protein ACYC18_06035 [Gammaproteobacteria bacterium]|nr:hypothetical protein [Gammaproteobacteria bacterium]
MTELVLQPTATAQWHALVHDAQRVCHCDLDEDLESYLVFLLMRFVAEPELAARVMALEYLRGAAASGRVRAERLRAVGDQCLLYSGLFPRRAERRLVCTSYFVSLGRTAYQDLADSFTRGAYALFARLAAAFVPLMDVLQTMRDLDGRPCPDLLGSAELWRDTGSVRAFRALVKATGGVPAPRSETGAGDGPLH